MPCHRTKRCGTRIGGQVMGFGGELGQGKEGYLAELLLFDGDRLEDLHLAVYEKNLHVTMKEGSLHRRQRAGHGQIIC
jgi:imidazolonepropionase-like amidohydrolase